MWWLDPFSAMYATWYYLLSSVACPKKKKKTISHQISDQSYASKKICKRAKCKLVPKRKRNNKKIKNQDKRC